jgi:aspartate/methionine/tyrosine aminotransferase
MTLKIASRSDISPFIVMDVMRAANAREMVGQDVLHLEVGQPSTPAPRSVIQTAKLMLDNNQLGYTDALGIPLLRDTLSNYYRDFYDLEIPKSRVVITTGSSGAFLLSFLAVFEHGDKVGLTSPGYPAYKNILQAVGVDVIEIPVDADTDFQLNIDILRNLKVNLDGLIIASPSNPTGSMLSDMALKEICNWCSMQKVRLISDEIYHGITFQIKATSALKYNKDAIIINSFSKYFSMTGWRLGWMIVPSDLIRTVECLAQNLFISPPTLSQLAAISVFECYDELNAYVERYARNRSVLLEELPKAGFGSMAPSDGAFYLYANVSSLTNDSEVFCSNILTKIGVAMTPGVDFDSHKGKSFVRLSYAGKTSDVIEASRRLKELFLESSHQ